MSHAIGMPTYGTYRLTRVKARFCTNKKKSIIYICIYKYIKNSVYAIQNGHTFLFLFSCFVHNFYDKKYDSNKHLWHSLLYSHVVESWYIIGNSRVHTPFSLKKNHNSESYLIKSVSCSQNVYVMRATVPKETFFSNQYMVRW